MRLPLRALPVACLLAALIVPGSASGSGRAAPPALGPGTTLGPGFTDPGRALSAKPIEESGGWRSYVLDSATPKAYPAAVKVLGDSGAVTNPNGLMAAQGSATTLRTGGAILVDLGLNVGGTVNVGITGVSGGPLRVAYSEGRRFLSPIGDTQNTGSLGRNDDPNGRFDQVSETGVYTSPGIRGAQRYMLLSLDSPGEVSIDFVRVTITNLRPEASDYTGHFLSSSKLFNRIWFAGAYTLNLNAVRDRTRQKSDSRRQKPAPAPKFKLVDGSKRDRLLWLGDLAMQGLIGNYTVRQMPAIVESSLRSFGCQQGPDGYIPMASDLVVACPGKPGPPDGPPASAMKSYPTLARPDRLPSYTPWYVVAVCDRFQFTGDVQGTRAQLGVMRRAIGYFESKRGRDGLFVTPEGAINWRAFDLTAGEDAHTNALWVRAMRRLALVESQIGDPRRAKTYRAMADRLAKKLIGVLYDGKAKLFLTNTQDPVRSHAQDGSVEALLSGVLIGKPARAALNALRKRLWNKIGPLTGDKRDDPYVSRYISPYMSGWELIARMANKDGKGSGRLLRTLWGRMAKTSPRSTVWEAMDTDGSPISFDNGRLYRGRTSLAHGWSAAPVVALSGYVAGMRPTAPGWADWIVEPQTLGLTFAQGRVGTIHGSLASRWEVSRKHASFRITVDSPAGTQGIVAVPLLGKQRTISRDGRIVWHKGRAAHRSGARRDGGYVRIAQRPGEHTYAWQGRG